MPSGTMTSDLPHGACELSFISSGDGVAALIGLRGRAQAGGAGGGDRHPRMRGDGCAFPGLHYDGGARRGRCRA